MGITVLGLGPGEDTQVGENGPCNEVAEIGVCVKIGREVALMVNGDGIARLLGRAGEAADWPSLGGGGGGGKATVLGEYCACSPTDHGRLLRGQLVGEMLFQEAQTYVDMLDVSYRRASVKR